MSAVHQNLPQSLPSHWIPPPQTQPVNDSGRIIFTRQLWQRTMPDGNQSDHAVLNKSQAQEIRGSQNSAATPSRRTSSSVSSRSQRRSPSLERSGSKTPLTPEESPPFKTTRKRNAGIVEAEDKDIDEGESNSAHTRQNSGDSGIHVCICQPDPKIPRPRNGTYLSALPETFC